MRKSYMFVYIVMLLVALAYFVLGIVELAAKANVSILGINIGTIYILAGFMVLVFIFIIYTALKKDK